MAWGIKWHLNSIGIFLPPIKVESWNFHQILIFVFSEHLQNIRSIRQLFNKLPLFFLGKIASFCLQKCAVFSSRFICALLYLFFWPTLPVFLTSAHFIWIIPHFISYLIGSSSNLGYLIFVLLFSSASAWRKQQQIFEIWNAQIDELPRTLITYVY